MEKEQKLYMDNLPSGHVRYTLRYRDPVTGKMKRISCVRPNRSRQSYNSAETELYNRVELGVAPKRLITLKRCAELYAIDRRRVIKEQTIIRNMCSIGVVNRWIGEDTFLHELTLPLVKNVLLSHCEKNITYNEKLRRYKAFLRWAYNNDLLESDFFNRLTPLPDDHRKRIEDKYLETAELEKLLEAMTQPVWFYVTKFMVLTGCRIGEVAALRDDRIHDDYIDIKETLSNTTGKIGETKTAGSERQIYVRPELARLISEIRRFMKEYKLRHGVPGSPYFICGPDGSPFCYDSYNKYLRELSERVLNHRVTSHALRHTAASLLIGHGVPLETVSRMLGHVDSKITKSIYIHITKELMHQDRLLLEKACLLG